MSTRKTNKFDFSKVLNYHLAESDVFRKLFESVGKVADEIVQEKINQLARIRDPRIVHRGDYIDTPEGRGVVTYVHRLEEPNLIDEIHVDVPNVGSVVIDQRSLQDRSILIKGARFAGFDYFSDTLSDDDYARVQQFVQEYWPLQSGDTFVKFMGYINRIYLEMNTLWTEDSGFSDFYETLEAFDPNLHLPVWDGGTYFPTSHVALEYDALSVPEPQEKVANLVSLFYYLAPIHLVLERVIGNIAAEVSYSYVGVPDIFMSNSGYIDVDSVLRVAERNLKTVFSGTFYAEQNSSREFNVGETVFELGEFDVSTLNPMIEFNSTLSITSYVDSNPILEFLISSSITGEAYINNYYTSIQSLSSVINSTSLIESSVVLDNEITSTLVGTGIFTADLIPVIEFSNTANGTSYITSTTELEFIASSDIESISYITNGFMYVKEFNHSVISTSYITSTHTLTPPWIPSNIASSQLWLDASRTDLMTFNGSKVATFTDSIGGKVYSNTTDIERPSYDATGFGGKPCLVGDGTQYLSNDIPDLPLGASAAEIWIVCSQDTDTPATEIQQVFSYGGATSNNSRVLAARTITGVNRVVVRTGISTDVVQVANTDTTFRGMHIIRGVWDGTSHKVYIDDKLVATDAAVPATENTIARLFANTGAVVAQFLLGRITDVVVSNALLSSGDESLMFGWALRRLPWFLKEGTVSYGRWRDDEPW